VGVGLVRVGRVKRHSPREKPAAAVVGAAAAAAVSSWATRVGGSAYAWPADSRAVIDCRQETRAHAHGKSVKRVDVNVIEGELTVGGSELMSHGGVWPQVGKC